MNRKKSGWLTVAFLFGLITTSMGQNQAVTYPAPEGVEMKLNGVHISDNMPGKPAWCKTADMARFFVGKHVEGVVLE